MVSGIQLISKQYNSIFITSELSLTIYTIKDNSEAVCTMGNQERTLQIWDLTPTNGIHADSPGVKNSVKILNLKTIVKIRSKYGVIDGSVVNGIRKPVLFKISLNEPAGYRVFCQLGPVHSKKKTNKSVWNTITFFLKDDNYNEVDFNGETLTFTLKKVKT